MEILVTFLLWFLLAEAILTAVQLLLRKKSVKPGLRVGLIAAKALLALLFAFLPLAGPVQLRAVQPFMMALYPALLADAAADAVCSVIFRLREEERRFGLVKAVSLLCGALFFLYGVVNMEVVTPQYHTYTSDKLTREHTVVFLADLHVGSAQPFSVTKKTAAAIKEAAPEAVILGGDIVDDYTTKEEMEATCRLFGEMGVPVYYIYGNHDRQGHAEYAGGRKFTPEELEAAMTAEGITVLRDQFAELAPDLLLLGREDLSEGEGRAAASSLTVPSAGQYLIVADHQPAAFKENAALGADLQLSGHTHAGQLFPLGLLYRFIGYSNGDYREGDAILNVTPGACGWRVPFRTDAHCRFEVVTLTPAG